jgi:hypothetical protein
MHRNLTLLYCVLFLSTSFSQEEVSMIKITSVTKDFVYKGAIGIKLECAYDYNFLKTKYTSDSLLSKSTRGADFKIYTTVFQNKELVQPAYGYTSIKRADGNMEMASNLLTPMGTTNLDNNSTTIFIPYASLKLPSEQNEVYVHLRIQGKDSFGVKYQQKIKTETISFQKPALKIFEFSLDSMIVNYIDDKGQAWDYSFSRSDAPDLDFNLLVGGTEVGNIHKGNSYALKFAEKPRVFSFHVSENDEVWLYLVDEDTFINDEIASWRFVTTSMTNGISYEQQEKKANLTGFHFTFKVRE